MELQDIGPGDTELELWELQKQILGSHDLAKACSDQPFDYALKFRTGEVIAFSGAKIVSPQWIHIDVKDMDEQPENNRVAFPAMRGMDVRISDIVWVMDAPMGS